MDAEKHDAVGTTFASHMAKLIDGCGMTQLEIARKLGYQSPNVISMIKRGMMKVPLKDVPPLAEVLGVDPVDMMRMALRAYKPVLLTLLEEMVQKTAHRTLTNQAGMTPEHLDAA